uniref:Ig-like domain-containing protein n=1 Tax=Electrophorus electricus TaxID=8005 RepID=A0AAY5EQ32_ELEEL
WAKRTGVSSETVALVLIFASVLSDVWKAEVVSEIEALVTSCVVIPCKFQYPGTQLPDSRVRGIWHKQKNQREIIYHEDSTNVVENFKGRTKLLGSLGQKNCTLEIDDIRNHDNGPFCFRAEIPTIDKYSFEEKCVSLSMLEPVLEQKKMYFVEGQHALFKCSVRHTCPSHPPKLTWSRSEGEVHYSHNKIHEGTWQVEALLSFTTKEQDHNTEIRCKAVFHGNKETESKFEMFVKGKARKALYLSIIIFVVLFASVRQAENRRGTNIVS